MVQIKPQRTSFGIWSSPISAQMLSQHLRLEEVQWDSDGSTLVWLEGRSDLRVLVAHPIGESDQDLSDEQSVRGGVGYGGGDFTVSQGIVFFSERDGRLYRRSLDCDRPRPITPPYGSVASPLLSPDGKWVVYVFSDGNTDLLSIVDAQGCEWPVQLVRGSDFYMQPAWHPAGKMLAWIEWNFPNMPWDGTRLKLGQLDGLPLHLSSDRIVAGDANTPVSQPRFSPDGRWLSYICSNGEWENLVLMNLETGENHILVQGDHFLLSTPAWIQGLHSYGWSHTSQRLFYLRNFAGIASLWMVDLADGKSQQINTDPYTWLDQLSVSPVSDQLAFTASAPSIPTRFVHWENGKLKTLRRSQPENISSEFLSSPQNITWTASDGTPVHGLYHPPKNPGFTCEGLPPAIINIHGGPTGQTVAGYSAETAYFTSRGYAVLEVNYRGSTGYGRTYQNSLREKWGLFDREDAASGANTLTKKGLADPNKLIIKGGSAGGYTVLNALIHYPGLFKAGVSLYGVSNLFTLAMDTHKFEKRYTDLLVGPLPETASRYHDWSPIFHAEKIQDALAVFQGEIDKVVTAVQSEEIVAVLRQRSIPHIYRLYAGEGHGFRKSENISDYFQQVDRFLLQHVIFAP
jgi:dipeptidyl aminopeptidase/acylaminoacyl peptidase